MELFKEQKYKKNVMENMILMIFVLKLWKCRYV